LIRKEMNISKISESKKLGDLDIPSTTTLCTKDEIWFCSPYHYAVERLIIRTSSYRKFSFRVFFSKTRRVEERIALMNKPELTELNIEIVASDASEDDLDRMTRQLLSELRDMEVESAELTKGGPAPHGTKSVDPVMMGNIAVAVLPSILPKVVEFVQSWALRGHGRAVKFKGKVGGQVIEFEGTAEDLQQLIAILSTPGKKK
jgi:hypothetical protein